MNAIMQILIMASNRVPRQTFNSFYKFTCASVHVAIISKTVGAIVSSISMYSLVEPVLHV